MGFAFRAAFVASRRTEAGSEAQHTPPIRSQTHTTGGLQMEQPQTDFHKPQTTTSKLTGTERVPRQEVVSRGSHLQAQAFHWSSLAHVHENGPWGCRCTVCSALCTPCLAPCTPLYTLRL